MQQTEPDVPSLMGDRVTADSIESGDGAQSY